MLPTIGLPPAAPGIMPPRPIFGTSGTLPVPGILPMNPSMMPPTLNPLMNVMLMNRLNQSHPQIHTHHQPQPIDKWANVEPNNTIYVNNLNEKVSRNEIMNGLREVFGQYGPILDIVCYTKIKKCKGQAWVIYEKLDSAKNSISELHDFMFFNKPLRVSYSTNISDATLIRDGKSVPIRERPLKKKKKRSKMRVEPLVPSTIKQKKKKKKKSKTNVSEKHSKKKDISMVDEHKRSEYRHSSRVRNRSKHDSEGDVSMKGKRSHRPRIPPNNTLFLQYLPKDRSEDEIHRLFCMFPGFLGLNLVPNKSDIAFVEFQEIFHATDAMRSINGVIVRGSKISVTYAQ